MVNQGIRIFAKIFLGKSTIYILNPIYLFYHAIYQNRHTHQKKKNDNVFFIIIYINDMVKSIDSFQNGCIGFKNSQ